MHELERARGEHPDLVTPDSPTQRVGGRPAEGFPTVEHSSRCSASTTPTPRTSCGVRRARAPGARARRHAGRLRRRAEDRRPQHRAHLRGRPARARRDARRRRARRGRHGQRADDSRHPASPARRARRAARGARRGLPAARRVRADQPRARGGSGEPLFANPRNAAAGTMRNLDPALVARAASRRSSTSSSPGRRRRRPRGPTTRRDARAAARVGAARRAALAALRASTRCSPSAASGRRAASLAFDTDGVVIKLDDLALRARLGATAKFPRWASRSSSRRSRPRRGCCGST
jgi:DNA ligase (NAD+)